MVICLYWYGTMLYAIKLTHLYTLYNYVGCVLVVVVVFVFVFLCVYVCVCVCRIVCVYFKLEATR